MLRSVAFALALLLATVPAFAVGNRSDNSVATEILYFTGSVGIGSAGAVTVQLSTNNLIKPFSVKVCNEDTSSELLVGDESVSASTMATPTALSAGATWTASRVAEVLAATGATAPRCETFSDFAVSKIGLRMKTSTGTVSVLATR